MKYFGLLLFVLPFVGCTYSPEDGLPKQAIVKTKHPLQDLAEKLSTKNELLKQEIEYEKLSHAQTLAETKKAAIFANRFPRLIEHICKNDPDDPLFSILNFSDVLEPSEDFIELMGLGEQQADELRWACETAYNELADFERENAVTNMQTDEMISYTIPKLPDEYTNRFIESIKAIINEDDHSLALYLVKRFVRSQEFSTNITIKANIKKNGRVEYKISTEPYKRWDKKKNSPKRFYRTFSGGGEDDMIERWRHLFRFRADRLVGIESL